MKFLIQHNLINPRHLQSIKDSIINFPHEFVGVIPFSHEITSEQPLIGIDYIPYGSTLFTMLSLEKKFKGLHFDLSKFNYEEAMKNRDDMLNTDMILTAKETIEFLKVRNGDEDWFIRPSEDLKHFSGAVIQSKECYEWLKDAMLCDSSGSYKIDEDMKLVLSKPKNIQCEWRYFIIDGEIVDGSIYRVGKQLRSIHEKDVDVLREAQKFADKWLPDSCCVMDLALADDELKVIEFNCINSSGFYDNDICKIFNAWGKFHWI